MARAVLRCFLMTALSTVMAAPVDRNITKAPGEITFQSAQNVYLTQNFPSVNGKCPCLQNQTSQPVAQLPDRSDADAWEIKQMLSALLKTQIYFREKLEETLSINSSLASIDENVQIHNNKIEQNLDEIERKLGYNQSASVQFKEMMMADKRINEEQNKKLDQIIDFMSNVSDYLIQRIYLVQAGICLYIRGEYPIDCGAVFKSGCHTTGVYKIKPKGAPHPVDVYCDISGPTKWTVVMSRYDGTVNFNRRWAAFKSGFGDVSKEHWLGLDTLYYLTNQGQYQARIEMREWLTKATKWAEFSTLRIGPESSKYKLNISGETGTATKGRMGHQNGRLFSTIDQENDKYSGDCAKRFAGGWWFSTCFLVYLTGPYTSDCNRNRDYKCMSWVHHQPLDRSVIKIRRA